MWAGWPDHPGVCIRVTEYRRMPATRRPARAVALAVESRRRLAAVGLNCALAALLLAALAIVAL